MVTDPQAQTPQVASEDGDDDSVVVCRSVRLARPAYRFYRDILLSFSMRGRAPETAELALLAARYAIPLQATLARLAVHDLVQRDPTTGAIRAAYPFSGVPTAHRVHLVACADQSPVEVFAMCAIDALGIPLMLRRPAAITAVDGLTGERVHVSVVPFTPGATGNPPATDGKGWSVTWEPAEAVVVARPPSHEHEHEHDDGGAADACCPITNFFASVAHARQWIADHSPTDAQIFEQDAALRHAGTLFAGVVDRLPNDG